LVATEICISFANAVRKSNTTTMGTIERKQRQKEEVYESILSAAWKLVKEDGWQGLSIRKIAEAIEYSIPVIYDHFENKEAILSEFTRQGFRVLTVSLKHARHASDDAGQQLKAVALAYWKFAFENQEYYQLMYGMGMPSCETVNQMKELQEFIGFLKDTIIKLLEERSCANADPDLKTKSLWSMLHGLVSINMMGKERSEISLNDEVLTESVNNFLGGIKA